jgi:hypothetical protein
MAVFIYRGWKRNNLNAFVNSAMRKNLSEFARDVQISIEQNEKLVADAMEEELSFHEDAPLLASIMTAIIHKYGDMSLGLNDMKKISDEATVSVYINTESQEMILSKESNLDSGVPTIVNFAGFNDDETYH